MGKSGVEYTKQLTKQIPVAFFDEWFSVRRKQLEMHITIPSLYTQTQLLLPKIENGYLDNLSKRGIGKIGLGKLLLQC